MKTIKGNASINVDFVITLSLTKGEAQALHAITGYGANAFLDVFYPKLGKAYLQPHEKEMRNLFAKVGKELPTEIAKIENAEKHINEALSKFK